MPAMPPCLLCKMGRGVVCRANCAGYEAREAAMARVEKAFAVHYKCSVRRREKKIVQPRDSHEKSSVRGPVAPQAYLTLALALTYCRCHVRELKSDM